MMTMLLSLLISFSINYVQYTPNQTDISYRKLTWNDFSLKKQDDKTVSESVTSIGYNYDSEGGVSVFCTLDTKESFVTPNGKTNYILNHEQRHFDITYIFAKKLVMELKKCANISEVSIERVYNEIISQKDDFQSQYDLETKNSENKSIQEIWDNKIDKLLK